jgi:hypothetical protein
MSPHGITIHQDTVWITDVMLNKVMQLDLQGNLLNSYSRDYELSGSLPAHSQCTDTPAVSCTWRLVCATHGC